jgi:hypothetical protein
MQLPLTERPDCISRWQKSRSACYQISGNSFWRLFKDMRVCGDGVVVSSCNTVRRSYQICRQINPECLWLMYLFNSSLVSLCTLCSAHAVTAFGAVLSPSLHIVGGHPATKRQPGSPAQYTSTRHACTQQTMAPSPAKNSPHIYP